jgi:hypothetical protein
MEKNQSTLPTEREEILEATRYLVVYFCTSQSGEEPLK